MSEIKSLTKDQLLAKIKELTDAIYTQFEDDEKYQTVNQMYQQLLNMKNEQKNRRDDLKITRIVEVAKTRQGELMTQFATIKEHAK